jgi:hypothetical protein
MSNYFRQVPDFEYVSRIKNAKIGDYAPVKNLFKRAKLRDDIFNNLAVFEKYKIEGDERPDNVAFKLYGDSNLDWVILLSNNIQNIQTEWPLSQTNFDNYMLTKYGTYENLYSGIHHYETIEVKNSEGVTIIPAKITISNPYTISYYDYTAGGQIDTGNIAVPVTNYEYEEEIENEKRNIYVPKSKYLNIIINDIKEAMAYKEGSSQYMTETLKKADNIRLTS